MTDVETSIREVLARANGNGTSPTPEPPASPDVYGGTDTTRAHVEMVSAIERVCHGTIEEFRRAAEHAESEAKRVREMTDRLEQSLNGFMKTFTGNLGDFLTFCQKAVDMAAAHADEAEQKLSGYPGKKAN